MASLQHNCHLLLEGVNSAPQKALQSDEEFYRYISSETSNSNHDENTRENGSEVSKEGDEEGYNSNLFENTMQSRVKCVTSGKVSRTNEGSTLGVLNDSFYESIGCHLSEKCCDLGCLLDIIMMRSINSMSLLDMTNRKVCCC